VWPDPLLEALFARGLEHERNYLSRLDAAGKRITNLVGIKTREDALAATLDAMRAGVEVLAQGAVADGRWYGRPDILLRVDSPSALGPWSYEVADTKLAIETRAGTILQLGLYCDLLAAAQGASPESFYVVTSDVDQPVNCYRVSAYSAYFRLLRRRLEAFVEGDDNLLAAANYPEPVDHCDVCAWSPVCSTKRRHDDHLSLVAGITRVQRTELQTRGINTVVELANTPLPLTFKPRRGALLGSPRQSKCLRRGSRSGRSTRDEASGAGVGVG
jgi:predicted RecB family nuclease